MKLKATVLTILSLVLFLLFGNSQTLYAPRNVEQAFQNGTRSKSGEPGPNYWQNHGDYNIHLTVLPPDRNIKGQESITYHNESPDTLHKIVLRLWLNFHKPEAPHLGYMNPKRLNNGIQINSIKVNGTPYSPKDLSRGITTKAIKLDTPLLPRQSIHLDINWQYKISLISGREGRLDSTSYYIAYFFPRVTVYDDYYGWDRLDFTGYQEFYNDFNDYEFSVTVPKNFLVWATGTLQNASEVLQPKYVKRLKKSYSSENVVHIAKKEDLNKRQITKQQHANTWKWEAKNTTDIAIAISDHYNWDAGSVSVHSKTDRRIKMQAAFNDTAKDFHQMVSFGKDAIQWFSAYWPGWQYPYPKMTAVQGYADMEYPMMINDASTRDSAFSRFVANHEIAHTYFPFFMGTNQSRYAFMDEGWATTFEYLIGIDQIGKKKADSLYKHFRVKRWLSDPSQEEQIPIITPSNVLRKMAYGSNAYVKPSLGYLALKDMLGDSLFRKCLHGYMQRWQGKHPIPWDFFYSFNDLSGRNLNWFWNSWFFSHGYIDLAITSVQQERNQFTVTIKNVGGFPNPFDLKMTFQDGSSQNKHFTSAIWQSDEKETQLTIPEKKKIQSLVIENGIWSDAHPKDNAWSK